MDGEPPFQGVPSPNRARALAAPGASCESAHRPKTRPHQGAAPKTGQAGEASPSPHKGDAQKGQASKASTLVLIGPTKWADRRGRRPDRPRGPTWTTPFKQGKKGRSLQKRSEPAWARPGSGTLIADGAPWQTWPSDWKTRKGSYHGPRYKPGAYEYRLDAAVNNRVWARRGGRIYFLYSSKPLPEMARMRTPRDVQKMLSPVDSAWTRWNGKNHRAYMCPKHNLSTNWSGMRGHLRDHAACAAQVGGKPKNFRPTPGTGEHGIEGGTACASGAQGAVTEAPDLKPCRETAPTSYAHGGMRKREAGALRAVFQNVQSAAGTAGGGCGLG